MREDILKIIKNAKDVSNAIILTHNIDFVFVQSVVIPALRKCGSPRLTIFADAQCSEETYKNQARVLSSLGVRYRVVSVAMDSGFRFHPKAILLSGTEKATLLIGSGNLTFGGWRENGEVWVRYQTDIDGTAPFSGFREYLHRVIELCAPPKDSVQAEAEEAFDPDTRAWALEMEPPRHVLGRAGHGASMLEQMKNVLGSRTADHLIVCAPYFDEEAEALKTAAKEFRTKQSTVLIQNHRNNLQKSAANALGPTFTLNATSFRHREQVGTDGAEHVRETWLHAKFYALQFEHETLVFAGSANCSRAALTIPGAAGNAELMAWSILPNSEFEAQFRAELVVESVAPTLTNEQKPADIDEDRAAIHIDTARMNGGRIQVAFRKSLDVIIQSALVDDTPRKIAGTVGNCVTVNTTQQRPRTMVLVGLIDGNFVYSSPHWIDNESALQASARDRSLGESIDDRVRYGTWTVGAWAEVLSELHRHLQYMPKTGFQPRKGSQKGPDGKTSPAEFQWQDVFSTNYRLPVNSMLHGFATAHDGRISSLRSMLLRWYGISEPEPEEGFQDVPEQGHENSQSEEPTDRVTWIPKLASHPEAAERSKRESNRAIKLVWQIAKRLGEPDFVAERRPELLAADLKVAVLLLRAGLSERWLSEDDFVGATLQIWLPLFFSAEVGDDAGLLERVYRTASSQDEFKRAFCSVELSGALALWALSMPSKAKGPEHARFVLAAALSVARLPWLWQTGSNEEIARQVAEALACTPSNETTEWDQIECRWLALIRRGYALNRLQHAVAHLKLGELSKRIAQPRVSAGELLWQGAHGFCVAKNDCERVEKRNCQVLMLQRGDAENPISATYLTPVAGLLEEHVLDKGALSSDARHVLLEMARELRLGLYQPHLVGPHRKDSTRK